jgi:sugar/nucleoside kinase (ribokinase family)
LRRILGRIDILSPNAEEALGLLSVDKTGVDDPSVIEQAAARFLSFGVGPDGTGHVIIRCGAMGAYGATLKTGAIQGWWVPAYWVPEDVGAVVDVTGTFNRVEQD